MTYRLANMLFEPPMCCVFYFRLELCLWSETAYLLLAHLIPIADGKRNVLGLAGAFDEVGAP